MSDSRTDVLLAVQQRWLSGWTIDTNSPEEYGRLMAIQLAAVERGFRSALADPTTSVGSLTAPGTQRPLAMSVQDMQDEFIAAFEAEKLKQAEVLAPSELTIWIEKNRPRFASSAESPETPVAAPGGM